MTRLELKNIIKESLRDWFKKEKWVRISTAGNIVGPCGTSKNKKNPDRCLPAAKARSLTKAQRAATARKKRKAGAKGKTVVKNTKKATVKKESRVYGDSKISDMLEKLARSIGREKFAMHILYDMPKNVKRDILNALDFDKGGIYNLNTVYADAPLEENIDPKAQKQHTGKSAPFGSAYKKVTKEDIKNLVVGLLHEMKSSKVTLGYDLEAIQNVVDHLRSNYKEGQDYILHIQRGDDLPNAITFPKGEFRKDYDLSDMLNYAQSDEYRYDAYTDNDLNEKKKKKDDRCTRIAKRKYDTWPSAYASGAVVRCRRGEIWKGVKEETINEMNCKYGKYFCPHDKVYKCRKGPKKSRS